MKEQERMWQYMDKIDTILDALGKPKEIPKGSFYDLSADEDEAADAEQAEKPKKKSGGQPGNQNARKHGFYSKHLPAEQKLDFEEALNIENPKQEIALLRVRINAILADPNTPPELLLQTIHAFARLISIQGRYFW